MVDNQVTGLCSSLFVHLLCRTLAVPVQDAFDILIDRALPRPYPEASCGSRTELVNASGEPYGNTHTAFRGIWKLVICSAVGRFS